MNVTRLVIKNIGKISDSTIEFNQPLILFYGEIRQGKSTILNAVRWVMGGEFPADIIRHGAREAAVELTLSDGSISRSWYLSKDGATKARAVVFVRNGKAVPSPVAEIKKFLNPFLLDQDHLRNKTELERKKFFAELFQLDTTELDAQLTASERQAADLRITIKSYGDIDLTPVDFVAVEKLKKDLAEIRSRDAEVVRIWDIGCQQERAKHQAAVNSIAAHNRAAQERNQARRNAAERITEIEGQIDVLNAKRNELVALIDSKPAIAEAEQPSEPTLSARPVGTDTTELEAKIQNGAAQNIRAEQFQKNKARDSKRLADEKLILNLERQQRALREQKLAKLKSIGETCGIDGLTFDESGNFCFQGTTAGMISDSQIMRLSSELSALYPEGFGLDLIDRAESLGKSIFEFVDRAKAEKKTILATIVGERPAVVPPEIGVFVVDDGKVTP